MGGLEKTLGLEVLGPPGSSLELLALIGTKETDKADCADALIVRRLAVVASFASEMSCPGGSGGRGARRAGPMERPKRWTPPAAIEE